MEPDKDTDRPDDITPGTPEPSRPENRKDIWIRGLQMLILAILFAVAETVIWIAAILQFGWMLFTGKRNERIAELGDWLGRWVATTTRFQCGASELKPFPWGDGR